MLVPWVSWAGIFQAGHRPKQIDYYLVVGKQIKEIFQAGLRPRKKISRQLDHSLVQAQLTQAYG